MNRWSVHVKNFGKIRKADIEVAPLTFFLGDNNSGKSYIMTLIYGLLNLRLFYDKYNLCTDTKEYEECAAIIEEKLNLLSTEYDFTLTKEEIQSFETLLNCILKENLDKFILELFNQNISIDELFVRIHEDNKFTFKLVDFTNNEPIVIINSYTGRGKFRPGYGVPLQNTSEEEKIRFLTCYILETLLQNDFSNNSKENVIYLPTARTGFLLTYKSIIGDAMYDKFNVQSREKNLLTRPTGDFLSALSSMSVKNEKDEFGDIIDFMQKEMLHGQINVSDLPTHDILYQPVASEKSLPMHVSSGVVTELAPMVMFLKYCDVRTLLIEEPEISLHPELQWKMGKLLIRLANQGVPVFVTTHSDLIIQHINNMIKLSQVREKKEDVMVSDYQEVDLINANQVTVYQFDQIDEKQSEVRKLSCSDYGFETVTFYNTLQKISEQIDEIEEYMEEK